ncbi:MAG: hypothetical protein FWF34_01635 [Alphaproteobacteria bacterium]|nr:hypothetical protein [Alphaproteobacteria bacterium]MCL2889939.1 hypothetical protein [Alphaproteobacteria bacterium]
MFWKVGFFVLLALLIVAGWVFMKANPMKNEGAASWTEFYSSAPAETMQFLKDNFGISNEKFSETAAGGMDYHSLKARGQFWPFAGVMEVPTLPDGSKPAPHTIVYLTVKDYDATHAKIVAAGAKPLFANEYAAGMKFGVYLIPGGLTIGIAQYGVKKPE